MLSSSLLLGLAVSTTALVAPRALFSHEFILEFHTYAPDNSISITNAFAATNKTSTSDPPAVIIYSSTADTPAFLVTNGTNDALGFDLTEPSPDVTTRGAYLAVVPPYGDKPWEPQTVPGVLNAWNEYDFTVNNTDGRISNGTTTQFYLCSDVVNEKPVQVLKSGLGLVFQGRPQVPEGCAVTTLYRGPTSG